MFTCSKASTRLFLKALLSYQTSSTDTVLVLRNDQPMKCLNLGTRPFSEGGPSECSFVCGCVLENFTFRRLKMGEIDV